MNGAATVEPPRSTDASNVATITTGPASRARVRVDGKFFRLGDKKFFPKGVTYGPFAPDAAGVAATAVGAGRAQAHERIACRGLIRTQARAIALEPREL